MQTQIYGFQIAGLEISSEGLRRRDDNNGGAKSQGNKKKLMVEEIE